MVIPEQLNHRRRVVYSSLLQIMSDIERINNLFLLLDPYVTRGEHFVASKLADVGVSTGLMSNEDRIAFSRAVMQNMRLNYEQLLPYPENLVSLNDKDRITQEFPPFSNSVNSQPSYAPPPTPPIPSSYSQNPNPIDALERPASKVFRTILWTLLEQLSSTPDFAMIVLEIAQQTEHKGLVRPILQPWIKSDFNLNALPANLSTQQMHGVVNVVYLSACEIVGPVDADRLLSNSMNQARSLREAKEFPPERLL